MTLLSINHPLRITPGDWEVVDLGSAYSIRSLPHDTVIATSHARCKSKALVEAQLANLQLIAHAPRLLRAAMSLLSADTESAKTRALDNLREEVTMAIMADAPTP